MVVLKKNKIKVNQIRKKTKLENLKNKNHKICCFYSLS